MRRPLALIAVPIAALLAIAGCSESSSSESAAASGAGWMLTSEPSDAVSVTEAKENAREGDPIVVRGRIGGRASPITAESPIFTIVDLELPHCGQMGEDDHCPTPWDYCCETPESIRSNTATIQLLGTAGGQVDPVAGGLNALDEVVVVGTVGPRPSGDVLTVRATGVYRP